MRQNIPKINQLNEIIEINKYINFKIIQKKNNNYNPDNNNIKYLVLFACHCNSDIKLTTIKRNLKYFDYDSIDLLLINSINLPYNLEIKDECLKYKNVTYIEAPNESTYDFGKWIWGLNYNNHNDNYDYTVFTNDSFIIHAPLNHFFNLSYKYNVEFYAYNDSIQQRYHYQSYLFTLRKDAISIFINNYYIKKQSIHNQEDVINNYELTMTDWFKTTNSFLKIGNLNSHKGKNIFFTNDILYKMLKQTTLLPFTKIKRII